MKSIVDKLSSRIDKVEKGGGGVKDHTHKSSEISDRISEYNVETNRQIQWEEYDTEKFMEMLNSAELLYIMTLKYPTTFSCTLVYNDQEYQLTNELNVEKSIDDNVSISTDSSLYINITNPQKTYEFQIKDLYFNGSGPTNHTLKLKYTPAVNETNMNVDQLMSAEAVRGYVENNVFNIIYPIGSFIIKPSGQRSPAGGWQAIYKIPEMEDIQRPTSDEIWVYQRIS